MQVDGCIDKAIKEDYQNYLKTNGCIPLEGPSFFKDGTGQHAVQIQVETMDSDLIVYIFIYDKSNNRMKIKKYYNGHIRSL